MTCCGGFGCMQFCYGGFRVIRSTHAVPGPGGTVHQQRAASIATAMSASLPRVICISARVLPKSCRVLVCLSVLPAHPPGETQRRSATVERNMSKVSMATLKPSPGLPSRFVLGTLQSLNSSRPGGGAQSLRCAQRFPGPVCRHRQ